MDKCNLLILDEDIYYIKNLTNYISSQFNNQFNTISFSEQEYFDDFLEKEKKIDVILTSMDFYERNIERLQNQIIVLLVSKNSYYNNLPHIKKYQSVEKICKEVLDIYKANKGSDVNNDSDSKLITFYSPIGGIGTTTIALNAAFKLSEQDNKVLYLSFESIQTIGAYIPTIKNSYNFSDLILSLREDVEEFDEILKNSALNFRGSSLYYFQPVDSVLDIEDLNLEGIKELIINIISKGNFNYIICDLPSNLNSKFYYLFEKSISVVSVIGQDVISNYKIDTMLKQLDNIKNFKFIFNMFDEEKERLIPRLVANNLLPIIATIPYCKEIKGITNLVDTSNIMSEFNEKIKEVVKEIK